MFKYITEILCALGGLAIGLVLCFLYVVLIHDTALKVKYEAACKAEKEQMVTKAELNAVQSQLDRERKLRDLAEKATADSKKAYEEILNQYNTLIDESTNKRLSGKESTVTQEDLDWLED